MHPADTASARLTAGNLQGCGGRVSGDHLQTTSGEQAGEGSGAAADIQDTLSAELVS